MLLVEKRFPATVAISDNMGTTFLHDKKIDAELYAYLQSHSYPDADNRTIVKKSDLDTLEKIGLKICIKSRHTVSAHLNYLIETGYVIDEKEKGQYYLPNIEDIYMMLPLDTIVFINDTVKENVIKTYIYLGQRWKWKGSEYTFTLEEIAQHLGVNIKSKDTYRSINNYLIALRNFELIDYVQFYEGKVPKHRLLNWSINYKK